MAYINDELIKEIRNKTDIVEIISNYVPLTKKGKNYFGVCPFHDDHSPSMSVSPERQIYTCFSCGATGNVFSFIANYEHISFYEAVKLLGDKLGFIISSESTRKKESNDLEIYKIANKFYQNNLYTASGRSAIKYLSDRKLDMESMKKFEVGLSLSKNSLTDYLESKKYTTEEITRLGLANDYGRDIFINRIMFPLYDLAGNVVAFSGRIYNTDDDSKYVNSKETKLFKKSNLLYNYHRARQHLKKNQEIIVMEGFMDVIRASTIGIDNCVATMGTAFTKEHGLILQKMCHNVILCFDGDDAGEKATIATVKVLESLGINPKVVRLENNLDPDEYILKNGKDNFLSKINNAKNAIEYKMSLLKKNKNLTDVKDVSKYIDELLKELVKETDDILVELSMKKMAKEFDIDYNNIKNKYDNYLARVNKKTNNELIINKSKIGKNKYIKAQQCLLYYMLKNEDVITLVDNKVNFMPNDNYRYLSNEIIYYYEKYGIFVLADFLSYINLKDDMLNTLKEIISLDIKDNFTFEEIEDYIYLINEYQIKNKIDKLELKLKNETNPLEQAKILNEIIKIKGVKE